MMNIPGWRRVKKMWDDFFYDDMPDSVLPPLRVLLAQSFGGALVAAALLGGLAVLIIEVIL